jgi:hypothetical protein
VKIVGLVNNVFFFFQKINNIIFLITLKEITFPTAKADTLRKFQFSLSSIKGAKTDGTASFECVSYSDEK